MATKITSGILHRKISEPMSFNAMRVCILPWKITSFTLCFI